MKIFFKNKSFFFNIILLFYFCCCYLTFEAKTIDADEFARSFANELLLDYENQLKLSWKLVDDVQLDTKSASKDRIVKKVQFKLEMNVMDFPLMIGFGMSDRGAFDRNVDLVVFDWRSWKREQLFVYDCHIKENGLLERDVYGNDYTLLDNGIERQNDKLHIIFEREVNTCGQGTDKNEEDYLIEPGTVHLVYFLMPNAKRSLGEIFSRKLMLRPFESKTSTIGMKQVQLIKSEYFASLTQSFDAQTSEYFDVLNNQVHLPKQDTVYWCSVYKLDEKFKRKHHITAFESVISESSRGVVHHMELFHCMFDPQTDQARTFNGQCKSEEKPAGLKQCRKVIAAWAMGAKRFVYPDHVGGLIGGENFSLYLVLEIHYDNAKLRENIVDSSGLRIYYQGGSKSSLRQYDAGILEVGLEYNEKNSIPPRVKSFHMHSFCLSECTQANLPEPHGITIFASQLHTHLTGRKVWTSLVRNGELIQVINSDNHFDPMFQEIRYLREQVQVLPGDIIVNTCVYETMDRDAMTLGGYSIRDEMCVNYMHYYPAVELEVCKSSIDDRVLRRFFDKIKLYDLAQTRENKSIKENFNSIRWTPLTTMVLSELYDMAPLSFSCNSSNGTRLPTVNDQLKKEFKYFPLRMREFPTREAPIYSEFARDCQRVEEEETNEREEEMKKENEEGNEWN